MNFIDKAMIKHGNKYDYSKVEYISSNTKVIIICKEHGEFLQRPSKHLIGQGCPICAGNIKDNKSSFIGKANLKHNGKYDYTKVHYINCDTNVIIICPHHGEFEQTPYAHLNSCGCIHCAKNLAAINRRQYDLKSFLNRSRLVHGDKYDYSEVDYINETTKVKIICPTHGAFYQRPDTHINRKHGCKKCGYNKITISLQHTRESFIEQSNIRHNNQYDYTNVIYTGYLNPVEIICPKHGPFIQLPRDHLNYCGCQKCGYECIISNGHKEIINFIKDNFSGDVLINDRSMIHPYEIDIFMPSLKLGIEYNGLYWHSYDRKEITNEIMKHSDKVDTANDSNIKLINIFENHWINNKELIKSMILNKIGLCNKKIFARKCKISEINNDDFKNFCLNNHIDGSIPTSMKYGLYYDDELVCVMGFNKHHTYEWEISRLASVKNSVVVGGASKLFKHFISTVKPNNVMTYANRCYSNGEVYKNIGFKIISKTKPNYKWIKSGSIYSRQQFQKHKLKNKLSDFDDKLSESQNMFNNGFRRIWDCGHLKLLWSRSNLTQI